MNKIKGKSTLLARMAASLVGELPIASPGGYYLEIAGGTGEELALISGAERLLVYTEKEICISKKRKRLRILGEDLRCLTYSDGTLEVKGKIFTVLIEGDGR